MNEDEIYKKIKKITNLFDVVQESIEFYKKEFSQLEDKLEYYSKYSWLPESKQSVKLTIAQMKEIIARIDIEQQHFDELEKQLDEIDNNL
jgi:hypothetical protein|tara:strand:+ start:139 stop:408 length:270 start_codon:yes stop_codon:yes gene_type:complete